MNDSKVCSRCGGQVDVAVERHQRPDGTFVSYAEGVCRSCGTKYDEASLLALEGPGPVGG
jgi:C4-type Zn-finger protein